MFFKKNENCIPKKNKTQRFACPLYYMRSLQPSNAPQIGKNKICTFARSLRYMQSPQPPFIFQIEKNRIYRFTRPLHCRTFTSPLRPSSKSEKRISTCPINYRTFVFSSHPFSKAEKRGHSEVCPRNRVHSLLRFSPQTRFSKENRFRIPPVLLLTPYSRPLPSSKLFRPSSYYRPIPNQFRPQNYFARPHIIALFANYFRPQNMSPILSSMCDCSTFPILQNGKKRIYCFARPHIIALFPTTSVLKVISPVFSTTARLSDINRKNIKLPPITQTSR
jgi:hypothetical protein